MTMQANPNPRGNAPRHGLYLTQEAPTDARYPRRAGAVETAIGIHCGRPIAGFLATRQVLGSLDLLA
jgi:hypothetical protein